MSTVADAVKETEDPAAPAPASNTEPKPLSKNAQKRLAKAARIAEQKKERRAYEKERRKEKKRELAVKRAAGEIDEGEDAERSKKRARTEGAKKPFHARIVVDLGFDDRMTENEIKSLTSQLAYTYSANRKAQQPFASLLFTSLNGQTYTRLEGMSNAAYKRWHDTEWWQESYETLWQSREEESDSSGASSGDAAGSSTADVPADGTSRQSAVQVPETVSADSNTGDSNITSLQTRPQRAARESVVYLTADSSEELTELKEGETYIIGGICDHNRYKDLCLKKSEASQIRSARLPIGTYLAELRTRKVLTVNQTFEILLKWVETKDWRAAFEEVVPRRKFKDPEDGNKGNRKATEEMSEEDKAVVIVDVAAFEANDEIGEDEAEGEEVISVAGTGDTTVVSIPQDKDTSKNDGPTTFLTDDVHPEVPQST